MTCFRPSLEAGSSIDRDTKSRNLSNQLPGVNSPRMPSNPPAQGRRSAVFALFAVAITPCGFLTIPLYLLLGNCSEYP